MANTMVETLLRILNKKQSMIKDIERGKFNKSDWKVASVPNGVLGKNICIEKKCIDDHGVFEITRRDQMPEKAIIYLHGGAYVYGMDVLHWRFVVKLVERTGYKIVLPDYPLAPEHNYLKTHAMIECTYMSVIKHFEPENIVFMGDSAGGGLVLSYAQSLVKRMKPQPKKIILLSPWLDCSMRNPELETYNRLDPMLNIDALKQAGIWYAGNVSHVTDPLVSPLYGSFLNLAPMVVLAGTHDILYCDAVELLSKCRKENVSITFFPFEKMVHVWMLLPIKAADTAFNLILQHL
jgi:monoterpene epsilon-lactone hydrolase